MEPSILATTSEWSSTKAYTLGVICLLAGVVVGALFHGSAQSRTVPGTAVARQVPGDPGYPQALATPDQGAPDSDKDPVLQKLQSDPNNLELLAQAGSLSMQKRDAESAIGYYGRSLKIKDDPAVRLNLGNAYAYASQPDSALNEFTTVLKSNPKDDKALFNTGVIRFSNKNDPQGAIAAWETLLKYYPNHPHRDQVQQMIQRAKRPVPKT